MLEGNPISYDVKQLEASLSADRRALQAIYSTLDADHPFKTAVSRARYANALIHLQLFEPDPISQVEFTKMLNFAHMMAPRIIQAQQALY